MIVHLITKGEPATKPVTPEVGLLGVVIVPGPLTITHKPVPPFVTVLPANVAVVTLQRF